MNQSCACISSIAKSGYEADFRCFKGSPWDRWVSVDFSRDWRESSIIFFVAHIFLSILPLSLYIFIKLIFKCKCSWYFFVIGKYLYIILHNIVFLPYVSPSIFGNISELGIQGVNMSLVSIITTTTQLCSTMLKPFLKILCLYSLCFFQPL